MVASSTSRTSWGAIPRPFDKDRRNWKRGTTWTPDAPKKRGGRKRLIDICPTLEENFLKVLHDHTAGDLMRADVKWTNLSRREIAKRLTAMGTPVSRNVVSSLLRKHGYRRRKAQKKKTMGPRNPNPNRNAQFENIAGCRILGVDPNFKFFRGRAKRAGARSSLRL